MNQASPASIYADSNFLYSRNGKNLYITIKLPISHFQELLHVFNVISLPVPVDLHQSMQPIFSIYLKILHLLQINNSTLPYQTNSSLSVKGDLLGNALLI